MSNPAFVEVLVPPGSIREGLEEWQLRRKVRSVAFHLQTEHDEDAPDRKAEGVPKGFKKFFSKQDWFDGWENFGKTWDVGGRDFEEDSPLVVVPRWTTIWEDNEDEIGFQMKSNEIEARKRRRGQQTNISAVD